MSLPELEAFVTIAALRNFSRAAEKLHRSQPAVSRRIALLETELGARLLKRDRGKIGLTPAGRAFLPHAEAVLAAMQDGKAAVQASRQKQDDQLSLALVGTLADTRIVDLLRDFGRHSPRTRINLRTATSREVSELVRRGEASLGLRYFTDPDKRLLCEVVAEEAMQVVVAASHRFAGRRLRDAGKLAGEQWVGFPVSRGGPESFGDLLRRRLEAAGLAEAAVTPIDSLTAQKRLVEAGFGVALLPESSTREELSLGSLAVVDVPALRTTVPVVLLRRAKGFLSPATLSLCEVIRAGKIGT
jgi:DNA-binding transcriptional LysR family regulator